MGRDERDRVPLGHFGQKIQEQSQSGRRHGNRLGLPARAPNLSAADTLLENHSSSCLVTGVFLHTVETVAIPETLESRVRPGPWPFNPDGTLPIS
jgi:hypothetical protein